jgi:hypothetical protein
LRDPFDSADSTVPRKDTNAVTRVIHVSVVTKPRSGKFVSQFPRDYLQPREVSPAIAAIAAEVKELLGPIKSIRTFESTAVDIG